MTSAMSRATSLVDRLLSGNLARWRFAISAVALAGWVGTAEAMAPLPGGWSGSITAVLVAGLSLFRLWSASPVIWWSVWAMREVAHGKSSRLAVICTAPILAVALTVFHVTALQAVERSSTGGMAYLTGPFFLLVGTVIGTKIASTIARGGTGPKVITFSEHPANGQRSESRTRR